LPNKLFFNSQLHPATPRILYIYKFSFTHIKGDADQIFKDMSVTRSSHPAQHPPTHNIPALSLLIFQFFRSSREDACIQVSVEVGDAKGRVMEVGLRDKVEQKMIKKDIFCNSTVKYK
jgi:hypothetical protein